MDKNVRPHGDSWLYGPAQCIGPAFPLRASDLSLHAYLLRLIDLLACTLPIHNANVANFYTDKTIWDTNSYLGDTLLNLSENQLMRLPLGEDLPAGSAADLVQSVLELSLQRDTNQVSPSIDKRLLWGMDAKKVHECCHLADVVTSISHQTDTNNILDIGV